MAVGRGDLVPPYCSPLYYSHYPQINELFPPPDILPETSPSSRAFTLSTLFLVRPIKRDILLFPADSLHFLYPVVKLFTVLNHVFVRVNRFITQ